MFKHTLTFEDKSIGERQEWFLVENYNKNYHYKKSNCTNIFKRADTIVLKTDLHWKHIRKGTPMGYIMGHFMHFAYNSHRNDLVHVPADIYDILTMPACCYGTSIQALKNPTKNVVAAILTFFSVIEIIANF